MGVRLRLGRPGPRRVAGLAFVLAACDPSARSMPAQAPESAAPTRTACPVPETALAWLDGPDCGLVLVGGRSPSLRPVRGEGAPVPIALPEACRERECAYALNSSKLGVLIVASRPGPRGETPTWVGLGVRAGLGYRFVDLWLGESADVDLTPAGPAYALAPHDCAGDLVLLATPRMPAAVGESPDPALLAAQGEYVLEGEELVPRPRDPAGCAPIAIDLP